MVGLEIAGRYVDVPVSSTATVLLGLLRVGVDVALLGEVAGEMLFGARGAVGEAGVVAVVELVGSSHCE